MTKKISLVLLLHILATWFNPGLAANTPDKSVLHVPAEACQQCHAEIYQQWQGSMHANSSALKDPIHGAFYRNVMGDPTAEGVRGPNIPTKKDNYPVCLQCHAPIAAAENKTKLDAKPAYANGVGCTTCHTFNAYHGIKDPKTGKPRYGIAAYEQNPYTLYGPSGITYSTDTQQTANPNWPHPVFHTIPLQGNKANLFGSNDICMGCHEQRNNSFGTPLCITGAEYAKGGSFTNCQACHMPNVTVPKLHNGQPIPGQFVTIADHTMGGGHDAKMLSRSVSLDMALNIQADNINVTLKLHNRLPHSFPTGAPFRLAYLKLAAYDQTGKVLWQNYQRNPVIDDPKAAFWYTLGNANTGKPTPPPLATAVLQDSRLNPNETRVLTYAIPASLKPAIVRAELFYDLLLPPLKASMQGKLPAELLQSKLVTAAEERL